MENKTMPEMHVDQDILDATPRYNERPQFPDNHGGWQEGAMWERTRNKWRPASEPPKESCWVLTKGGFRSYDLMYYRASAGKFFVTKHSDVYDGSVQEWRYLENDNEKQPS